MFVNNNKLPPAMFLGKTFYHYNRLMVTHIGMKLSTHTYYVTPMTHKWFPWQQPTTISLRKFSLKSLLHFSNLPTMVHMEMKLCAHTYFIVSITTVNKKFPQALFPITTSSLLKLANYGAHGDETLCAYVFHCFHYNGQQKIPSGTFPYNYFFTSQTCTPYNELGTHVYFSVSMTIMNKKMASGTFPYNYFFTSQTCKPCNAWS